MTARRARTAATIAFALLSGAPAAAEIRCGEVASARRAAVQRGTAHLKNFFEKEENRAALGADAVSIFLELGETAADAGLRARALEEARRLAAPLAQSYAAPHGLDARDSLVGALSLLPDSQTLHLSKNLLLSAVRTRLAGRDPDETYGGAGFDPARLDALDEDALFDVLIAAYTVERARVAFPELPAPAFSLRDVLRFVFARPLVGFEDDDADGRAVDHFYLATHVAYVLSDYSRLRLAPEDLGSLVFWLRAQFSPALERRDLEAVAELVDVFRGLGATDADADVCRGTRLLLASQRADGSWKSEEPENAYDAIHPTWVAVHALRERTFLVETPWAWHVHALLDGLRCFPAP